MKTPKEKQFHDKLVKKIEKLKSVEDVKDLFENPNKYGDTISHISFKHHVQDRWNYSKGDIVLNHEINQLFISDKKYLILNDLDVNKIIKKIKSVYELK